MKFHVVLTGGALALALLAPAAADAHRAASSKSVGAHVRAAGVALDQFEAAARAGAGVRAQSALASNRRHMRAAAREARRVRRSGGSARATTALGLQADSNARVLARVVGELSGRLQADAAAALRADLAAATAALAELTRLLAELPATAQGAVVQAIATLSQGGEIVTGIIAALRSGDLTAEVQQLLRSSLGLALGLIDAGVETLNRLVGVVGTVALPLVQQSLALVTGQLGGLTGVLEGLGDIGLPGLPGIGGGGSGSFEIGIGGGRAR